MSPPGVWQQAQAAGERCVVTMLVRRVTGSRWLVVRCYQLMSAATGASGVWPGVV